MSYSESQKWYQDYLQSSWWETRRNRSIWLAQWQCQCPLCPDKNQWVTEDVGDQQLQQRLEVHHLTYERLGYETDEDLIVLCAYCHKQIHGLIPIEESPREWRWYRQWLRMANNPNRDDPRAPEWDEERQRYQDEEGLAAQQSGRDAA